jgi:hypothetical protein
VRAGWERTTWEVHDGYAVLTRRRIIGWRIYLASGARLGTLDRQPTRATRQMVRSCGGRITIVLGKRREERVPLTRVPG